MPIDPTGHDDGPYDGPTPTNPPADTLTDEQLEQLGGAVRALRVMTEQELPTPPTNPGMALVNLSDRQWDRVMRLTGVQRGIPTYLIDGDELNRAVQRFLEAGIALAEQQAAGAIERALRTHPLPDPRDGLF